MLFRKQGGLFCGLYGHPTILLVEMPLFEPKQVQALLVSMLLRFFS